MKSIAEIRLLRERLVADASRQRHAVAKNYSSLQGPANLLGRGIDMVHWLRRNPLVVGLATAVLVVMRPRGALKLAGRGLVAWRAIQTVRGLFKAIGTTP
jgi:hypothetical protein